MEGQIFIPKIKNGSLIIIGNEDNPIKALTIAVDKHFNLFQKKMMKFFQRNL